MGENLLIDTNIIIDALRGQDSAIKFLDGLNVTNISVVTASELLQGCVSKKDKEKIAKLIEGCNIVHITEEISKRALKLLDRYSFSLKISFSDAQIAATCFILGYKLVTRDKKHFSKIEGIDIYQPPTN